MKKSNLKSWQPGISGNPKGRPKGAKSIKKTVVALLNDPNTNNWLPRNALRDTQTPLEAIVCMLMVKSMRGDVRAADVLLRYAIDRDELGEERPGFFDGPKTITFQVIDSKGDLIEDHPMNTIKPKTVEPEASQIVEDDPDSPEITAPQTDPYAGQFASTETNVVPSAR